MGVPPKHPFLNGFSIRTHPFWDPLIWPTEPPRRPRGMLPLYAWDGWDGGERVSPGRRRAMGLRMERSPVVTCFEFEPFLLLNKGEQG